jgi:hypothetical protein
MTAVRLWDAPSRWRDKPTIATNLSKRSDFGRGAGASLNPLGPSADSPIVRSGTVRGRLGTTYATLAFDDVLDATLGTNQPLRRQTANHGTGAGTASAYGFFFIDARPQATGVTVAPHSTPDTPSRSSQQNTLEPLNSQLSSERWARVAQAGLEPRPTGAAAEIKNARTPLVPQRALARRERAALDELVALGAGLGDTFSAEELRSAFRALARRYHPDRQARSSEADKARCATLFQRVYDAYRVLATLATSGQASGLRP